MEKATKHSRLSTAAMRKFAVESSGQFTLIQLTDDNIEFNYLGIERMEQIARDSGAAMVYSDYIYDNGGNVTAYPLIDYQEGSIRDDFDFGKIVMVPTRLLKETAAEMHDNYDAAGWYDLRLRLSRKGSLLHIPEPLYTANVNGKAGGEKEHFAYVDPRNRASQIEMERVATAHLAAKGCIVTPSDREAIDLNAGVFPVEASVIIPVKNRRRTIADAVKSALAQTPPFEFNVIVVDNGSTDGTSDILTEIAASDSRLKVINTTVAGEANLGIGGCWNLAINSEYCGRFAVQLDSDDVYSDTDVLTRIVAKFREENCGMVIGSYLLTDFDRNVIPPGLIDHAEWTDENGANNALRINGLGAPRAFFTPLAREISFPNVSYGEDYAMGLAISRRHKIGRIYEPLYLCRRWEDNTDHALPIEKINRNNLYKDRLRTIEINSRKKI